MIKENITNKMMNTRDVLKNLDFEEVWGAMTDQEPAYQFDFANFLLSATHVMSMRLRPVFLFGGVWTDGRTISEIDFEMPLTVESFEQGVAWITNRIGLYFKPRKSCPWLTWGWEWQNHLPWVQRMNEYKSRPQCLVDRDWFKLAAKKMRELSITAHEKDLAIFSFNGKVLLIDVCGQMIPLPATGDVWPETYAIKVQQLDFLPKRFMRESIYISVWEGKMVIGNRAFNIINTSTI